jgi:hypothetical protein
MNSEERGWVFLFDDFVILASLLLAGLAAFLVVLLRGAGSFGLVDARLSMRMMGVGRVEGDFGVGANVGVCGADADLSRDMGG